MKKEKIYRAGLIPYYVENDGKIKMLFMKPSDPMYGGPDLQIAKGRIDDTDESTQFAAIREAEEELGLKQSNVKSIQELGVYLGRTTFYVAEINDPNDFNPWDSETSHTEWLTIMDFHHIGRRLHLPVVEDAYSLIKALLSTDSGPSSDH